MRQYEGAGSFTPEKAKEMLRAVEMKKTRQTYLAAAADCGFSVDQALLRELQRIYDEEVVPDEAVWNLKIFTAGGQETVDYVELGARFVELVGWGWLPVTASEARVALKRHIPSRLWGLAEEVSLIHPEGKEEKCWPANLHLVRKCMHAVRGTSRAPLESGSSRPWAASPTRWR